MEMFRYKFAALSPSEIKQFLAINKLDYTPIDEKEKDDVKDGLYESTIGQTADKIENLDFYKVHFTKVLDLVRSRRCYLKSGYAYVNAHDFVSIIATWHESEIERGLEACQKILPEVENDERIFNLLKGLLASYMGKDNTVPSGNAIPVEEIDISVLDAGDDDELWSIAETIK